MESLTGRPTQRLEVPRVAPQSHDVGLVLVVNELRPSLNRRWWYAVSGSHQYLLPTSLNAWARGEAMQARCELLKMPAVYAFKLVDDKMRVRLMSRSRRVGRQGR